MCDRTRTILCQKGLSFPRPSIYGCPKPAPFTLVESTSFVVSVHLWYLTGPLLDGPRMP